MSEDRYRGGGTDRWGGRRESDDDTPHPTEKRYATQARHQRDERRSDRASDESRPRSLSPLMDIVRYDERHHYGRHSVERRQEKQGRRRDERDEQTRRRMRREQRGRSYGGDRRGPQSRSSM